jgi:cysteine desulfurase/selenocysteine lyase
MSPTSAILPSAAPASWRDVRKDFPILDQEVHGHRLIYFDNAATTQKPRKVIEAVCRYYEKDNANVHRGIHELSNRATAGYEAARSRAAEYLHARAPEEVIFTRGTTEGINLVAQAWGSQNVKAGDTILLTELEHHSNIVPWQLLAERTGAKLAFVPVKDDTGVLDLTRLNELLASRPRIFAFTHISNSMASVSPVADMCVRARRAGVATLVDAAQSAGHRPLDVQEIGCDFLACSGHKMCGPTGIGLLYVRAEVLESIPPYQGGGEMIQTVEYYGSTWKHGAHRFEAGTPDISGAIGLRAAMDYLDGLGRDRIARHDAELGAYAYEKLARMGGLRVFGPQTGRAGLVSFLLNQVHAHDVVTLADQLGLALRGGHHCNQPLMHKLGVESTVRASFYLYNTTEEIDRAAEVLQEIKKFFSS